MPNIQDRSRFLLTVAAIAVSVLLFACGEDRRSAKPPDTPVRKRVSQAVVAMPPPSEPIAAPVPSTPPQTPQTGPVQPPPPVESEEDAAPEPETRERPLDVGGTRVFSNKDLRRYARVKEEFGLGRDKVTVDLTPKTPADDGPAAAVKTDAERDEEISDTMKQINELNAEAAYLKSRIPSLHNPFLARVKPSEADAMAEAGMDNAERLNRVNERLAQVGSQLSQLQRRLAELHQAEPAPEHP